MRPAYPQIEVGCGAKEATKLLKSAEYALALISLLFSSSSLDIILLSITEPLNYNFKVLDVVEYLSSLTFIY